MPISHLLSNSFYLQQQDKKKDWGNVIHNENQNEAHWNNGKRKDDNLRFQHSGEHGPGGGGGYHHDLDEYLECEVDMSEEMNGLQLGSDFVPVAKNEFHNVENPVLIDTDGGCYDAWALILAKAFTRREFNVVGITTVNGATTSAQALTNCIRVLNTGKKLDGKEIPIFKGMSSTLLDSNKNAPRPSFFGSDGFGDTLPPLHGHDQDSEADHRDHAVNGIIQLAEMYKGRLTIIALGPLTNLAMAVKLRPAIKSYIKEIFILGGNSEGIGNISVSSEFHFYLDPEAAYVVLKNFSLCPMYILPWETCLRSASTYEFRRNTLGQSRSPEVELMNQIEAKTLENNRDQWLAPEAILVACVLNREIMKKLEHYHCTVELQGIHTRGMMVVDKNFLRQKPANCIIISEIDRPAYETLLLNAVTDTDAEFDYDLDQQVRKVPEGKSHYYHESHVTPTKSVSVSEHSEQLPESVYQLKVEQNYF